MKASQEKGWAVSTIMTRQNIIPAKDGKTMITALIPFWDMINHKNGIMSTDFNPKLNQSECLAFEDFKANDQVFMFYGDRTNADMFLHNGFVYPDNENDGYSLRLGISKSDKLSTKRIKILEKLKLYEQMTFMLRPKPKSINDNLLKFVKVFIMNEDEINSLEKQEDQSKIIEKLNTSGDELNKRCYRFLSTRLMILLNAYPTKLDDDIALLKNDDNQLTECKKVANLFMQFDRYVFSFGFSPIKLV
ncbi:actin-histidine N-methyltransferase [Chrysoperla carnea]|uniref:actin-histidine N-methyltransferase n=1 Tax=Chrysoperla carnea TaxID=189513 RepID=UPI001D06DCB8|nr:actin-histidine N-methyltransferase [Chrysoperla carnea]